MIPERHGNRWRVQDGKDLVVVWIYKDGLNVQRMVFISDGVFETKEIEVIPFSLLIDCAAGQKRFYV